MAVFVMDERQRHFGRAQHRQRIHRVHQVGDDRRRLRQCAQIERLARQASRGAGRWSGSRRRYCRPTLARPGSGCAAISASVARSCSPVSDTSIQSTSVRGVITSRTGRSARRTMPEMIARSLSSSTPAVCASATTRWSSSAVTAFSDSRSRPRAVEDQRAGPVEQPDERRRGAATATASAAATNAAIGSGERSANCFGTISPITSDK